MRPPFDWLDVRRLAHDLNSCPDGAALYEAKKRAGISRVYYSVFIRVRQVFGHPKQMHRDLITQLKRHSDEGVVLLGNNLGTLHGYRKNADYDDKVDDLSDLADTAFVLADSMEISFEKLKSHYGKP